MGRIAADPYNAMSDPRFMPYRSEMHAGPDADADTAGLTHIMDMDSTRKCIVHGDSILECHQPLGACMRIISPCTYSIHYVEVLMLPVMCSGTHTSTHPVDLSIPLCSHSGICIPH